MRHPNYSPSRYAVMFLLGSIIFLYLHLFILPFTPIYRVGDALTYLQNAAKMLNGDVIYRDFFQFTLPGTELVYLCLFKIFGARAWIPNLTLLLLGIGLTWLSVVISKPLMSSTSALLPGLLFLILSYRFWLDGTHHWFSVGLVLAAVAILMKERSPARLAGAGALCGLALCFTQARGMVALLGLAIFLLWERKRGGQSWDRLWRNEGTLLSSFLVAVVAFSAYFIAKAGLNKFLECTVLFSIKYYPANIQGSSWRVYFADLPYFERWNSDLTLLGAYVFIHVFLPLVYLAFFVRYRRVMCELPVEQTNQLMLLGVMGLGLFAGVAAAPGWLRLCSVSLPALILLVWLLDTPGKWQRILRWTIWPAALMIAATETWDVQHHWRNFLDTPAGRTAFLDTGDYERHQWTLEHTTPGDYFFEAEFPRMYFSLGLQNPAKAPYLTNTDYTRPEQVRDAIEALESHRVRYVIWSDWLDLPTHPPSPGDHLAAMRDYLRAHYYFVKKFPGAEYVLQRRSP